MSPRRRMVLGAGLAALAAAGTGIALWQDRSAERAGAALLAARFPDLAGRMQSLAQWRGRVIAVNFWATWCAPCREETPLFVRLQHEYRDRGLQFVGIAIDDAPKVRAFAAEYGVNYPQLLGGIAALELARNAGNQLGALPYTVVLNRDGRVAATQLGAAKLPAFEGLISRLL